MGVRVDIHPVLSLDGNQNAASPAAQFNLGELPAGSVLVSRLPEHAVPLVIRPEIFVQQSEDFGPLPDGAVLVESVVRRTLPVTRPIIVIPQTDDVQSATAVEVFQADTRGTNWTARERGTTWQTEPRGTNWKAGR